VSYKDEENKLEIKRIPIAIPYRMVGVSSGIIIIPLLLIKT